MSRREKERRELRRTSAKEWAKQQKSGFEPTCIKLPEGVEFFKIDKPGIYKVDFMPYIAGKYNPRAQEGYEHFELEYMAHRVPTQGGNQLYCCSSSFKKPCYVCEWLRTNRNNPDENLLKSLRGQTRHLWIINDKPGDFKNPLKVFDTNHYNRKKGFGEQMVAAINVADEYENFWLLEGGMTVSISAEEETFPGGKYYPATRIDFFARKYNYPEDTLERAPCLDDCLVFTPHEEMRKILDFGAPSSSEEEESPRPVRAPVTAMAKDNGSSKARVPVEDDEDEDEDFDSDLEDDFEEDDPPARGKKR